MTELFETPSPELREKPLSAGLPILAPETAASLGRWQTRSDWITGAPLVLGDLFASTLSILMLQILAGELGWSAISNHFAFTVGAAAFTLLVQHVHGLYPACGLPHSLEFRRTLRTSLMVVGAVSLAALMSYPVDAFPFLGLMFFAVVLPLNLCVVRSTVRSLLGPLDWWAQPVLVIGDGIEARRAFATLLANRREGLRPVGIAFESSLHWRLDADGTKYFPSNDESRLYVGPVSDLDALVKQTRACRVMLTNRSAAKAVDYFAYHGIPHVTLPTDLGYHPTERTRLTERNGTIELHCYSAFNSPGALLAKRLLDLSLIALFAPILLPLIAVIVVLVKLSSPGPIFFGSKRVGQGGTIFHAWKFRSMVTNGHKVLEDHFIKHPTDRVIFQRELKLKNDPRITTIGRFLRKTSLDELPQLWNVIRREMSLVGPRPILEDEHEKYGVVYDLYISVLPGITGLWQVSGRNNLVYEERLRYTRFYIQNWSCTLDLYILWRTVRTALFQEGAY